MEESNSVNLINTDEIVEQLQSKAITVVRLDGFDAKGATNYIKGDLEDFITAAKALNENVVFLSEVLLSENDFFHEPNAEILGEYEQSPVADEEEPIEGINLIQFSTTLGEYEEYIGQTHFLLFRLFFKNHSLSYLHYPNWIAGFNEAFDEAEKIFESKEKKLRDQKEQEETTLKEETERRETGLVQLLEALADDDKFVSLSTQKAKQEYAVARYPELTDLSPQRLKDEISNLNARIQAKKMLG